MKWTQEDNISAQCVPSARPPPFPALRGPLSLPRAFNRSSGSSRSGGCVGACAPVAVGASPQDEMRGLMKQRNAVLDEAMSEHGSPVEVDHKAELKEAQRAMMEAQEQVMPPRPPARKWGHGNGSVAL